MVSTSTTNPGITSLFDIPKSTGTGNTKKYVVSKDKKTKGNIGASTYKKKSSISSSQNGDSSSSSSSGDGIVSYGDAAADTIDGGSSSDTGDGSSSGSGSVSSLLKGEMTFEQLVGEICNGIDLIFATKRSTVVITDYEAIYAEAKYLRDNNSKAVAGEDIKLWQLEEGTYELDVSEYGYYNTVKVNYKNGTVTESYEDLVRVFGEVTIEYDEKDIDKTTAIMKAKAYLAAHVRDFDMSIKANLLWDGDIDVGDIVTIENPLTMRDKIRVETEERDPEYYFVMGKSITWDGETPMTGTLELRYGAVSPEKKDVPESGTAYSKSSSGNINSAIEEVGQLAEKISYSSACQTHDCVQSQKTGDCWGMSDYIACELKSRGVETKILQYAAIASNHRSVKYQDSDGSWKRFPYRNYNINTLFRDTDAVESGKEVNKTC